MKTFKIYTDGSTKGNGKKFSFGGWAYAIYDEEDNLIFSNSGAEVDTTNNKMEMTAILKGIEAVKVLNLENSESFNVEIFTDSAYIHNCYKDKWYIGWQKNGWVNSKREPVKNKELWEELIIYFERYDYFFNKVKGHADSEQNILVDKLAVEASTKIQQEFKVWE